MGDFASPFRQPPPAPSKSNLPTLYYGLVVLATTALLLALYNLLIVRWCTRSHQIQRAPRRRSPLVEISTSQSCGNPNRNLLSSFKYKKGVAADEQGVELNDCECAVCLSAFEEGEDVRKLPQCKHSFHAPCIDMWLYSHSDCPLCRSPVGWRCHRHVAYTQQANSQENVQDPGSSV